MSWKSYGAVHNTETIDLSSFPSNTQEIYFAVFNDSITNGKELVPFIIPYCTLITEEQSFYSGMYNNTNSYVGAQLVVTKTSARIALFIISGANRIETCELYVFYK